MTTDTTLTHSAEAEPTPNSRVEETAITPKPATAIKRWIRLDADQTFGSITGSEFRIWGEEK